MFQILLLLFLIVPIIEIYLLIQVGGWLGAGWTIFLVIFTAVLGAWLLRLQGFSTIRRVQDSMARGEIPAIEMLGGVLLLISGALLLTPGFFTDTVGFLFLVPSIRRGLVLWFLSRGNVVTQFGFKHQQDTSSSFEHTNDKGFPHHQHRPRTYEGEYRKDD